MYAFKKNKINEIPIKINHVDREKIQLGNTFNIYKHMCIYIVLYAIYFNFCIFMMWFNLKTIVTDGFRLGYSLFDSISAS